MPPSNTISLATTLLEVLGGIGLFLYGLKLMSDMLQKVVGSRMKTVLGTLTKRPIYGLVLGAVVTGIIQSSSATTVMVVGLINAGLMPFVQSVGVILGTNIGSTLLPQIVAFNPGFLALPAIGFGMVIHIFLKNARAKDCGFILVGFGILFLGMNLMKKAIPVEAHDTIQNLFLLSSGGLKGALIGLLIGTLATAVVQASGVTVGIIVLLASQGMFSNLEQAIPLVLGCNIGTCVTALIASIDTDIGAKRAAVSHTFFNVFGAVLTLGVLHPFYLWIIPKMGGELSHQVANFHVMVKTLDALLFIPIVNPFATFIAWVVPEKAEIRPSVETPRYLDDRFINKPMIAIELAIKEILRLGQVTRSMVKFAMDGFLYRDETLLARVSVYKEGTDLLRKAILDYIVRISEHDLAREDIEQIRRLILALNNFDHVAGQALKLLELGKIEVSKKVPMVGTALRELKSVYRNIDAMLTEVSAYLPEFKR